MIESQRPSVVDAALGLMAAIDKIERESSDSSQPICSMPRPDWTYVVPEVTQRYWQLVMIDMDDCPRGMYGLENMRSALHAELAAHYGLTHAQTKEVTDNMDKLRRHDGGCSIALHEALQALWDKYPSNATRHDSARSDDSVDVIVGGNHPAERG